MTVDNADERAELECLPVKVNGQLRLDRESSRMQKWTGSCCAGGGRLMLAVAFVELTLTPLGCP